MIVCFLCTDRRRHTRGALDTGVQTCAPPILYGSTEVPVTTVGSLCDLGRAADTDGRPGIADVRLVDGEIRARGPQMLVGYLHPEDNRTSFDDAGYFRTGDLGRFTDDGYLVVTGRAKDIIIRNGENISPKERSEEHTS